MVLGIDVSGLLINSAVICYTTELRNRTGPRLRELAPATRGGITQPRAFFHSVHHVIDRYISHITILMIPTKELLVLLCGYSANLM